MQEQSQRSVPIQRVEWQRDEIVRVGMQVVNLIADHLTSLPERPVFRPYPPALVSAHTNTPPPRNGDSVERILEQFLGDIEPYPFGNGHPRFFGWVNSAPDPLCIFADALASAMNPSCAGGNHAAVYLEREVVGWFRQILGLPDSSTGLLLSGGSMAALTALAAARYRTVGPSIRTVGLQPRECSPRVYMTSQCHGCHQKAVELLGLGRDSIRTVPYDALFRMDSAALEKQIEADLGLGHHPMVVIASAGTVNTGAIDPLDEIADVCARRGLWLHVDAAYGGPAILTAQYAGSLRPLGRADSVALDPHKWLSVPVECGLVLVRDESLLRKSFSLVPEYLQTDDDLNGVAGPVWFSEYGFQQTRGFRALKLWMGLRHHGTEGYRTLIERDLATAAQFAAAVQNIDCFAVLPNRSLSIVCFRCSSQCGDPDGFNRTLLSRLQMSGECFFSGTILDGTFWIRACFINRRTTTDDVLETAAMIRRHCDALLLGRDHP